MTKGGAIHIHVLDPNILRWFAVLYIYICYSLVYNSVQKVENRA
jgi:hypothetical protein